MSGPSLPPPGPQLQAVIVVPARNEQDRIGRCLEALADQNHVQPDAFEVLVVLDRCTDLTCQRAAEAARVHEDLRLHLLDCTDPGVGAARRLGMDTAAQRLRAIGATHGLIVSTDADSVVAGDWLAVQLRLAAEGARAIGGTIELDEGEAALLPAAALASRVGHARTRLNDVLERAPAGSAAVTEHHHFSGASLALTVEAYAEVGGLPVRSALEDEALARALDERGVAIWRSNEVRVRTSARTSGRAPRGLARDLALASWRARRTFSAGHFHLAQLVARKHESVSVVLPAREVAGTIGQIVGQISELRELGLVDEILVVDAASVDGTGQVAAAGGATVLQESELLTQYGPARGKGDAMWRALAAATGELVVYVDADTENFNADYVIGLLGPLLTDPGIHFVKGAFSRPLRVGAEVIQGEGGRVTELVARPLLNLLAPELAAFDQPLAGELAGRRKLLESLPFAAGYGVEIGMLIDAARAVGTDGLAQVRLGARQNRHQSLRDLSAMAYAVMVAALKRLGSNELASSVLAGPLALPPQAEHLDMEVRQVVVDERPPLRDARP